MHPAVEVSVVIANRNTRQMLQECLASVVEDLRGSAVSGEIIVVDNGSTDGSVEMVGKTFPDVLLVRNQDNVGYAAATNQGILRSRGRFVLLLNSDTVVRPGVIQAMADRLRSDPRVAGVAPKLLNPDGTIQQSCYLFPMKALLAGMFFLDRLGVLDDYRGWDHRHDREVDWVSSAAMMVPRSVLDTVGLLDETFFYGVDADWAQRATAAGYKFLSISGGEIVHHGKGSRQGAADARFAGGPAVQLRYLVKHHGPFSGWVFRLLLIIGSLPRLVLWELVHIAGLHHAAGEKRMVFRRLIASALRLHPGTTMQPHTHYGGE